MNGGGAISPLDLTTTKQVYQQPVQVWCDTAPDDTSTSGQEVGLVIDTQSTPNTTTLSLSPPTTSLSNNLLPIKLCLGRRNATQLCLSSIYDKRTYKWGGGSSKVSLSSLMFIDMNPKDKKYGDKCHDGKGEPWCADLWGYAGPYRNMIAVHFVTDPLAIANAPPAPGKYTDKITATINGNVGTGKGDWSVFPSAVDFSGEDNPTIYLTATLEPDCRIDSAPDVSMSGNLSSQLSSEQTITVTCTNTTPYTMSFAGANDIAGWHQMKSDTNSDMLRYQIYSNSTHTALWNTQKFTGSGLLQKHDIYYATDPLQANLPAGTYQDTETLTVSY
ncbi:Spore coat protein U (SCPU) domain-containing protein [Izhakiella capsodis]|uniref:Spore coat protein U (SCPU) domain-containing protein n=2 Tax=Izhakiella capsodis TaxID=1367852 RepID=A0A1I4V721_9GAMM|nr:Spore coat protein U (SCPU) domain-containing protein [Izhakiella capsodis]